MKATKVTVRLEWMRIAGDWEARLGPDNGYAIGLNGRWYSLASFSRFGAYWRAIGVYGSLDKAKRAARRDLAKFYR